MSTELATASDAASPIAETPPATAPSELEPHPPELPPGPPVAPPAAIATSPDRPPVRAVELAALVGLVGLVAVCRGRRLSPRALAIGALVVALSARSIWQGGIWTFLLGLSAVFSLVVALRTRRSFVPEVWVSSLFSTAGAFVRLWDYFRATARLATAGRLRHVRWSTIVVPVAVVGLFGLVFTAANPLIERWVGLAWDALSGGGHFFSVERVAFWLFAALVSAGLLAPRIRELRLSERLGPGHVIEGELVAPGDTAVTTARNLLLGVNVLFFAYNALDAVYLWAGTPPPGLDHTTYAHRGTAWLTVSLLMSTFVLGLVFRGGMNARSGATRLVRILGLAWAAQNFVLAAGTFRRIAMYVDDSGLTMLRCFGIAGVVVVAVAFALIVLKVARRHTTLWLLRRQLDAFLIALVVWTVAPVDMMVWSYNVARIEQGQDKPLLHLFEQHISPEGVPALAALVDHPDPVIAAGVADRLDKLRHQLDVEDAVHTRWTQAELSRARDRRRLRAAAPRIATVRPDEAAGLAAYQALRLRAFAANGMDPSVDTSWSF